LHIHISRDMYVERDWLFESTLPPVVRAATDGGWRPSIFSRRRAFRPGSCASRSAIWATTGRSAAVCGKPDSLSDPATGSISADSGRNWFFYSSEATRAHKSRTSGPQDNPGPSFWR
jgi:hypothetical protein